MTTWAIKDKRVCIPFPLPPTPSLLPTPLPSHSIPTLLLLWPEPTHMLHPYFARCLFFPRSKIFIPGVIKFCMANTCQNRNQICLCTFFFVIYAPIIWIRYLFPFIKETNRRKSQMYCGFAGLPKFLKNWLNSQRLCRLNCKGERLISAKKKY